MRARATQLGYKLEQFSLPELQVDGARLAEILYARGIQGVILPPVREGISELGFDYAHFSAVAASHSIRGGMRLHAAMPGQYANMHLIMRQLATLGYNRIGFFTDEELTLRSESRWLAGYLAAVYLRHGTLLIPPLISPRLLDAQTFERWFLKHKPDAVVSTEPFVMKWLRELKIPVPEEVGFASTSVAEELFGEPVSGVDEMPEAIGAASVDLVSGQINRNELDVPACPKAVHFTGEWTGNHTVSQSDER